jgi:hypothetical protein
MSNTFRVIAEKAYINEGLREQGELVELPDTFKYDKARDGDILEPVPGSKADKELKEQAKGDRTLTDGKISRDPRTDSGGTNDLA